MVSLHCISRRPSRSYPTQLATVTSCGVSRVHCLGKLFEACVSIISLAMSTTLCMVFIHFCASACSSLRLGGSWRIIASADSFLRDGFPVAAPRTWVRISSVIAKVGCAVATRPTASLSTHLRKFVKPDLAFSASIFLNCRRQVSMSSNPARRANRVPRSRAADLHKSANMPSRCGSDMSPAANSSDNR